MNVHVLFDANGEVHALFHPSTEANAPDFTFHPTAGQHAAVLSVPAELEKLTHHELHAAVSVQMQKGPPRLIRRIHES